VRAAVAILGSMATFGEAAVNDGGQ
jgi:hypothetical protein